MIGPLSDVVNVWRKTYTSDGKGGHTATESSIGPYRCRIYTERGSYFRGERGPEPAGTMKIIGPTGTLQDGDRIEHSPSGTNYILRKVRDVMGSMSAHHIEGAIEEWQE